MTIYVRFIPQCSTFFVSMKINSLWLLTPKDIVHFYANYNHEGLYIITFSKAGMSFQLMRNSH